MGIGCTTVGGDWARKSISVERTFRPISGPAELHAKLAELAAKLAEDVAEENLRVNHNVGGASDGVCGRVRGRHDTYSHASIYQGKTITLKLKLSDFQVKTRAKTLSRYISSSDDLLRFASPV